MIKLLDILNEISILENFYFIKDTKLENPLTQYILDQLKGKIPALKNIKDPKLEASGAEGIVISLDDYRVIKLFFSIENAAKSVPFLNKNISFSAKITSIGTIRLNEEVIYAKKGSIYSKQTPQKTKVLYYVVMERVVPDSKTYNDLENSYVSFSYLKNINDIKKISNYLNFTKGTSLEKFAKEQILKPFLEESKIQNITSEDIYNNQFDVSKIAEKIGKKEANNLIQLFMQWKKNQTKLCLYVFGENKPLLLKWALLSYIGKYNLDYDINKIIKSFYDSLKNENKNNFNEIVSLLKEIIIQNKIDWKDIHKEQFGRIKSSNKLVAIDIGIKTDSKESYSQFNKNVYTVDIKRKSRQSISEIEGENTIEQINFFDFDGTLFLTPGKEEGSKLYKKITGKEYPHEGWAGRPESLLPEYNIQINPKIVPYLKKALNNPKAKNFLLTNRNSKLENQIKQILKVNNIEFDGYLFKTGDQSKSHRIEKTFEDYPDAKIINVYDDKTNELYDIDKKFKSKYGVWRPEMVINLKLI